MRYAQIDRAGHALTFLEGKPDDWPDLAAAGVLQPCGPDVAAGWRWDGSEFVPPPVAAPDRVVAAQAFRRRFSGAERTAITLAASRGLEQGDATLQVWLDDLNSATEVSLDSPDLREGLGALVAAGLLTEERLSQLLA